VSLRESEEGRTNQLPPAPPAPKKSHAWIWAALGVVVVFGLIVGGALERNAEPNSTTIYEAPSESGSVDWENYSPSVKARIDSLAAAGDCSGLQRDFDIADENDDAQRARVGSGNADLMSYIDAKLSEAGCYE
jgi:hypothetical protein